MASERGRLVPTRRSRRLAGIAPLAEASSSLSSSGDGLNREMTDGSDDMVPQIPVDGRPSPVRRFSDPTFGESLPSGSSLGSRQSSSSTTSPARSAAGEPVAGTSSSAASAERSNVATLSVGSPGGLRSRGRRGVGAQRVRHEQGTLLRTYTEQLRSSPVQGESFCRCPQQGQSRDLHCVCGEDDHGDCSCFLVTDIMQIFLIGTLRYSEGLWHMRRHGPVIAHCTDSEDFPDIIIGRM